MGEDYIRKVIVPTLVDKVRILLIFSLYLVADAICFLSQLIPISRVSTPTTQLISSSKISPFPKATFSETMVLI
jgi:hypothetical protein